jgi:hypothetical protein
MKEVQSNAVSADATVLLLSTIPMMKCFRRARRWRERISFNERRRMQQA